MTYINDVDSENDYLCNECTEPLNVVSGGMLFLRCWNIVLRQHHKDIATSCELNSLIHSVALLQWDNCFGFSHYPMQNLAISTNHNSFCGTYERSCCSSLA